MCNEWKKGSYRDEISQQDITTWTWTDPSDSNQTIVLYDDYDPELSPNGGLGQDRLSLGTINITDDSKLYFLDLSNIECNKLDEVDINNRGFMNCFGLYGIKFPKTIDTIPSSTFGNCTNLQEIEMPGVKYIGNNPFKACTSLQELTLPEGYEVLDTYDSSNQQYNNNCTWLAGLKSLTKITLPSTLTTIASNAFVGLSSLQEVVFTNNTIDLTMNGTTFGSNSSSLKLYFNNEELKNTYSSYIQGNEANNYGWDTCGLTYSETLVDINPNPPTPPTPEPTNPSNTNIGLIAGIAGGVVGAILLIMIIVLIAKKSKQRKVLY